MPEYRTTDGLDRTDQGDPEGGGGSLDLESVARMIYDRIREDPRSQVAVARALNTNYGIPGEILAPVFPAIQGGAEGEQDPPQQLPDGGSDRDPDWIEKTPPGMQADPATDRDPLEDLEPEDVASFLDEVIGVAGADMTLGELRSFVDENPGMVRTALKMA